MAVSIPLAKSAGFFVANVSLGSPPQEMHLMLDTGSSAMWVADSSCLTPGEQPCPAERLFQKNKSKTAQVIGDAKPIQYMDKNKIEGKLLHDTVWLGGVAHEGVEVLLAKKISGVVIGSGLIGLEYEADSETEEDNSNKDSKELETKGFLDSAIKPDEKLASIQVVVGNPGQSQLPQSQILLNREPEFGSNISFSADAFTRQSPKWYASLRAIGLSTQGAQSSWKFDFNRLVSLGAPALLDSGAGAIRLGSNVYDSLLASLPDCKKDGMGLHCACGEKEKASWGGALFPSLSLSFESYENSRIMGTDSGKSFLVCIPPEAYVASLPSGRCRLAIADGGFPHRVFGHEGVVLGMPVLQAVDFAYDAKRKLVGLTSSPSGSCADPRESWISTVVTPFNILVLFLSIVGCVMAVQNLQACARVRHFLSRFTGSRRSGRSLGGDLAEMGMVGTDQYREHRMSRLQASQNTPMDQDVFVAIPEE